MTRRLGSYTCLGFSAPSGRTREGALLRGVREELVKHVGGNPNAVQRHLIDRAAWVTLQLAVLDRKTVGGTSLTKRESATYVSLNLALARILEKLGPQPAAPAKPKTLAEHLAERASAAA